MEVLRDISDAVSFLFRRRASSQLQCLRVAHEKKTRAQNHKCTVVVERSFLDSAPMEPAEVHYSYSMAVLVAEELLDVHRKLS